jgi:hypothetical protein
MWEWICILPRYSKAGQTYHFAQEITLNDYLSRMDLMTGIPYIKYVAKMAQDVI